METGEKKTQVFVEDPENIIKQDAECASRFKTFSTILQVNIKQMIEQETRETTKKRKSDANINVLK